MDITARLLRVYQLDRQLDGLQSRLKAAERFLNGQEQQLTDVESQRAALETQVKQITASVANLETEMKGIDDRMEHMREQMNQARTNKEYKTFLTEVNTLKADKTKLEEQALAQMAKSDELKGQLEELDKQRSERKKVRGVAKMERDTRKNEIAGRLEELKTEREKAAAEVPDDVLSQYDRLYELRDEDAMAPVEIADRKRHEYNCGACMMSLPMEVSISLLGGKLTFCSNCQCILFLPPEAAEALTPAKR